MTINNANVEQINVALLDIDKRIKALNTDSETIKSLQNSVKTIKISLNETQAGLTSGATYDINISGNAATATNANHAETATTAETATNANHAETAETATKVSNALTVNGKTYDGSSAVDAGVQTVANGGTGVTTQADINKAFISNLDVGTSDVTDGTEFVSSWASDNGFAEPNGLNKPYKRKFIKVWSYIKDKISSVLGLTKDNYGGKANTAGTADTVDNYHANQLWRSDGAIWNPKANINLKAAANGDDWSFDIFRNGKTGCHWLVWDTEKSTLLKVSADDGKVSAPYGFIGNLSGKADTAGKASFLDEYVGAGGTRPTSGNIKPKDSSEYGGMRKDVVTSSMGEGYPNTDGHLLTMFWDNSGRFDTQLFIANTDPPTLKVRSKTNRADYGPWIDVITEDNISSQNVAYAENAGKADTAEIASRANEAANAITASFAGNANNADHAKNADEATLANTVYAGKSTLGQVLTSNGSSERPSWQDQKLHMTTLYNGSYNKANGSITLSDSIENYSAIVVMVAMYGTDQIVPVFVPKAAYYWMGNTGYASEFIANGTIAETTRRLYFGFLASTPTILYTGSNTGSSGHLPTIKYVIGIK